MALLAFRLSDVVPVLLLFGTIILVSIRHRATLRIPKGLRLPPGPPPKPIIGNASDMPTHHDWDTYISWKKLYGDIIHLKVLRLRILVLNSERIAHDLLDSRSAIYSSRPYFPMAIDIMKHDWSFALMPYGSRWRQHRKAFYNYFQPKAVSAYHDVHIRKTRAFLNSLHENPSDFVKYIRHLAGATTIEIVYGVNTRPTNDPYITAGEDALAAGAQTAIPGTFFVDALPILKHIPEWMPGANFHKKARTWRSIIFKARSSPFQAVKDAINEGTAQPSVVTSLLNKMPHSPPLTEADIQDIAGTAFIAGADTVISILISFFLAMVLYPDVQSKAQAELDAVVGPDRLPAFDDRENLPYINAVCKEIYRWRPALPLGVAHCLTQDDVYEGYFIPRGTLVLANSWAMLHDEKTYGRAPDQFRPERFFENDTIPDPEPAFGFGRRLCPGRYMADNSVFMVVACVLKVFSLKRAVDERGKEIPVRPAYTSGFVSYPEPFQCAITPRSKESEALLSQCAEF